MSDLWMNLDRDQSKQIVQPLSAEEQEQARHERIAYRRARIAAKLAKEKADEEGEDDIKSIASSIELLTGHRKHEEQIGRNKTTGGDSTKTGGTGTTASTAFKPPSSATGSSAIPSTSGQQRTDQLDTQLEQCQKELEQLLLDGETLVTNVKVAVEYRERTRQDSMKKSKKERLARLKNEAHETEETYKLIQSKWFMEAKGLLPLELYNKIQEQQMNCDKLLDRKQELIDDLQGEMEANDVDYEDDLEKYQNDMMLMGDRIDEQVDALRTAFMQEFQLIEDQTALDREVLLEKNQQEWMDLLKKFEELDTSSIDERQKGALERFDQLGELLASTREEANRIKQGLQDDFRTLQMELENIKVATIMNSEKLEYNLEVLRRRELENIAMKNSMKRYLLKLQDKFRLKVQEYRNQILTAKNDNTKIIKEIKRLEEINSEAQNKTLHFITTEYQRFMDLWKLNEEEAKEKLIKLNSSEKLIFETQFGLKKIPPKLNLDIFDKERPGEIIDFTSFTNKCGDNIISKSTLAKKKNLQFPNKEDVSAFWEKFVQMLNPKGIDWNAVVYCLTEFHKLLKIRNKYINDVNALFYENMELSFLLKKHLQGTAGNCFSGAGDGHHNPPQPFC